MLKGARRRLSTRVEVRPVVDRIYSWKTCAAHVTNEGHLAALLINAHDGASLLDRLAGSRWRQRMRSPIVVIPHAPHSDLTPGCDPTAASGWV